MTTITAVAVAALSVLKYGDRLKDRRRELVSRDPHFSRHPEAALQHRFEHQYRNGGPSKTMDYEKLILEIATMSTNELSTLGTLDMSASPPQHVPQQPDQSLRVRTPRLGATKGKGPRPHASLPPSQPASAGATALEPEPEPESPAIALLPPLPPPLYPPPQHGFPEFSNQTSLLPARTQANNATLLSLLLRRPKSVRVSDLTSQKWIRYPPVAPESIEVGTGMSNPQGVAAVAVCFVGQFVRPGVDKVRRHVRNTMAGAPQRTQFDAFFSMSTQHSELDTTDELRGSDLCQSASDNGFRYCEAQLIPYNGSTFIAETKDLGFLVDITYPVRIVYPFTHSAYYPSPPPHLFPCAQHRTASFFHTISRCAHRLARTMSYQNVMFTRLDVYQIMVFHNFKGAFPSQPNNRVIGTKRKDTVDDRVLIGPVKYMVHLSKLHAYFINLPPRTNRIFPESILNDFFEHYLPHFKLVRKHCNIFNPWINVS